MENKNNLANKFLAIRWWMVVVKVFLFHSPFTIGTSIEITCDRSALETNSLYAIEYGMNVLNCRHEIQEKILF